jgi:pimeloyl-ACP methyl ester carboxylesterase
LKIPSLHISGAGKPLIWMHGMLNSVELDSVYSLVDFEQLAELCTLIRYNYCNKLPDGTFTWEYLTEELQLVLDNQHVEKSVLGGLSMGAGIALHAAVNYPERVRALILVTPPPAWETREDVKKVYRKIASRTNPENIPEFLKRIIIWNEEPPEYYVKEYPEVRQNIQELRLAFHPEYYTRLYLGGAASDMPSREQISQLTVPTLIVALDQDPNHPLGIAQELHSLIKGSAIEVVGNLEDHLNLTEKVCEFLRKLP